MDTSSDEPPIDKELLWRLGKIFIAWSSLESLLSMLLGTIIGADLAASSVVTNSMSTSLQVKCVRGILSVHALREPATPRITQLLDRADELRSERNELAHGLWHQSDPAAKTALVHTVNLDRPEIMRDRLVTVPDLDDLLVHIDDWIADYVTLGREVGFPASRGKRPDFK
jgi:hypothetical protein